MPLRMIDALADVEEGFIGLCVEAGRRVLGGMMERDREQACGPKGVRDEDRQAIRGGSVRSRVTFGGRRIEMKRLRARSRTSGEIELPSFAWASSEDPLNAHTFEAVAAGVATRKYGRSLEALPAEQKEHATSKSAVSRRFVAMSAELIESWLARSLEDLDVRAVLIDGLHFRQRCILIALGVSADGHKRVLGLCEGSTENAVLTQGLIDDLVERGLRTDRSVLFVIDGAKGLAKAIRNTFGELAVIHRCQLHKIRNVIGYLPEEIARQVKRAMTEAYAMTDANLAKRRLEQLANALKSDHPGASNSIREGLTETLALQTLGIRGTLYRSLRTTNAIENLNSCVGVFTRNVKRWRDGEMVIRWVGTAVHEAEQKFRRLRGYKDMPKLVAALDRHQQLVTTPKEKVRKRAKAA
jgi:transposase-like protein